MTRRHARSFYFASPFLPRNKRRHAFAVYALCRRLDDAVDEAPNPLAAQAAVATFEAMLDDVYADRSLDDDVLEAARQTVAECDISRELFVDLARGVEADLTVDRYGDWQMLERYCYLVAGVVGLMMCGVFDVRDPAARPHALAMGNAMQLTNILRDVKEDWQRGRLYLPAEDLQRFGVTRGDIDAMTSGRPVTDGFRRLMTFEISRARKLYADGYAGLGYIKPDGGRQTAAVMAHVYGGILDAIERGGYDVFASRRRLPFPRKLLRVPAALIMSRAAVNSDGAS